METNKHLKTLVEDLRRAGSQECKLWLRLANDLDRSTRLRRSVNVSRLARHTKENDTVVVPGKVLGSGELQHSLTVAAWGFSNGAREQIEKAKGKCVSIQELMKTNPKGQKVRIIG